MHIVQCWHACRSIIIRTFHTLNVHNYTTHCALYNIQCTLSWQAWVKEQLTEECHRQLYSGLSLIPWTEICIFLMNCGGKKYWFKMIRELYGDLLCFFLAICAKARNPGGNLKSGDGQRGLPLPPPLIRTILLCFFSSPCEVNKILFCLEFAQNQWHNTFINVISRLPSPSSSPSIDVSKSHAMLCLLVVALAMWQTFERIRVFMVFTENSVLLGIQRIHWNPNRAFCGKTGARHVSRKPIHPCKLTHCSLTLYTLYGEESNFAHKEERQMQPVQIYPPFQSANLRKHIVLLTVLSSYTQSREV